jgi:hypothetical protein
MKEETSFDFNMSALRVWSLISDLRSFARWHPVYRIAGEAERGAEIDVTWLLFGGDRKMTTQMIINRLTKPQLIGWQMGVRGFLTLDERYEIEPIANGVCVHHSVECRGIVGALVGRMMRLFWPFCAVSPDCRGDPRETAHGRLNRPLLAMPPMTDTLSNAADIG